uniref:THAP-type domain-containing protein n=1 Tax=Neogobius melanostomus TaxID=47308 RepID=A0A8C6SIP4_9GOBI
MVIACCAVGCVNRQGCKPNVSFYHIPDWQPSKYSRICSEHFYKVRSQDPLSPDYVPSVFAHTKSPAKRRALKTLQKYGMRQEIKRKRSYNLNAEYIDILQSECQVLRTKHLLEQTVSKTKKN